MFTMHSNAHPSLPQQMIIRSIPIGTYVRMSATFKNVCSLAEQNRMFSVFGTKVLLLSSSIKDKNLGTTLALVVPLFTKMNDIKPKL